MDSIRIDTGVKKIQINDGPDYIEFNPSDVGFAERFYAVYREFETKQAEYQEKAKALDAMPDAVEEKLRLMHDACEYMREKIDYLFGQGTSQKAFGSALSLDAIGQLFDGLRPFIKQARSEKMRQYLNSENAGRVMK